MSTTNFKKIVIKISEIVSDLENGLSRYEKDNLGAGSVQAKYGLDEAEVRDIFRHDKLKGLKQRKPKRVFLVDEDDSDSVAEVEVIVEEIETEEVLNDLTIDNNPEEIKAILESEIQNDESYDLEISQDGSMTPIEYPTQSEPEAVVAPQPTDTNDVF